MLSLAALLILSVFASPMLRILAAAPYQGADRVVPYLVVSTVFANMFMFAPGLVIAERTRAMAKYTAGVGVANLVLAWVLVPPLGITGAGLATATTSVAWFVILMRASQIYYPVPHRWTPIRGFGFAILIVIGCRPAAPVTVRCPRAGIPARPGSSRVAGIVGCSALTLNELSSGRSSRRSAMLSSLGRWGRRASVDTATTRNRCTGLRS